MTPPPAARACQGPYERGSAARTMCSAPGSRRARCYSCVGIIWDCATEQVKPIAARRTFLRSWSAVDSCGKPRLPRQAPPSLRPRPTRDGGHDARRLPANTDVVGRASRVPMEARCRHPWLWPLAASHERWLLVRPGNAPPGNDWLAMSPRNTNPPALPAGTGRITKCDPPPHTHTRSHADGNHAARGSQCDAPSARRVPIRNVTTAGAWPGRAAGPGSVPAAIVRDDPDAAAAAHVRVPLQADSLPPCPLQATNDAWSTNGRGRRTDTWSTNSTRATHGRQRGCGHTPSLSSMGQSGRMQVMGASVMAPLLQPRQNVAPAHATPPRATGLALQPCGTAGSAI
jgi:hypothetical protein